MIRTLLAAAFLCCGASLPSLAQDNDDFAAMLARQAFIEGRTEEAYQMILPLAEKGVPRAQTIMGFFHETGVAPDASPEQAVAWYEKAADQGQPQGIHNLAYLYHYGELGLPVDLERARALYTRAAQMDFGSSLHNLAQMVLKGEGGPQDTDLARALYERAVTLGEPAALADYAYVLATGDGLPADLPKARRLYSIAAAHGIDWAERDYAEMMELGQGGPVDLAAALDFYRRSAAQGYGVAAFDIFEMYRANPADLADLKQEALTMCFYAESQPPQWDGSEYDGQCDPALSDYTPSEIEAARTAAAVM
jgi:TPR repeat protein